jgi:S-adenosylmethionine:tRNA ribosyltransferase-isomerase
VSRTADYDFDLPPELIAQHPAELRSESRLLVLERASGSIRHRLFRDVVDLVRPGDLMVVNETRVFPARLKGHRASGGEAEILLLRQSDDQGERWEALVRPGAKLRPGRSVEIGPELAVDIVDTTAAGDRIVHLRTSLPPLEAIERYGEIPLPPYVRRQPTDADRERYQTVYARSTGSVAAPTAGLHFTPELMAELGGRGVTFASLVLHVGVGTFRPVDADDPAEHRMHSEWFRVPEDTSAKFDETRRRGGAVWAVGTTTVRTLESVAAEDGSVPPAEGWTDIFIRPPHRFRAVDHLITNFHLPRSTLLMLVSAFAGREVVLEAYREAVELGYRFFSYGDAMAIL